MNKRKEEDSGDERFYCCCWSCDLQGHVYVLAAGEERTIKVFDVTNGKLDKILSGHGKCVNDLRAHPLKPYIVLSCSKVI